MEQPKIDWHRMGWRWWLETIGKLGTLIALFSTVTFLVGEDQPRWVIGAVIFGCMIVGVMLIPTFPREGEEDVSLKEALKGTAIMIAICAALAILAALAFAAYLFIPEITRPVLKPLGDWLNANLSFTTVLLLMVIYLQCVILDRLPKRR